MLHVNPLTWAGPLGGITYPIDQRELMARAFGPRISSFHLPACHHLQAQVFGPRSGVLPIADERSARLAGQSFGARNGVFGVTVIYGGLIAADLPTSDQADGVSVWVDSDNKLMRSTPPISLRTNVVGFWDLDNDGDDDSGNGFNGTVTGATFDGTAATFSGSESIDTACNAQPTDFTVTFWAKVTTPAAFARIVDKKLSTGFWLGHAATLNALGGGVLEGSSPFGIFGSASDGSWHHVVSVRSGTTHLLYVDGSLATSNTVSGTALSNDTLSIGAQSASAGGGGNFTGLIRCVGFFNDAKDSSWVTSLYNGGTPLKWANM